MRVVKIGGNELNAPVFVDLLAQRLSQLTEPAILIHGGGKDIDELQLQLGQQPVKIQGMRKTDTDALNAAMMILCGLVSKKLVAKLINAGVDAIGLCGVDGGLLRTRKYSHPEYDLGWVGDIIDVRSDLLSDLSDLGIIPVLSSISLGEDGQIYNVNADQAASSVAIAVHAQALDFVSNVPGVIKGDKLIPVLKEVESEHLILQGSINSGMIPKVRAAFKAVREGVPNVRIVDLENLLQGGGTQFVGTEKDHLPEATNTNSGGKP
jgi:acetylglutamate kinase